MLSGWPRSGWPQVGHFDQKIKVNQIASYCAVVAYDPVLLGSCIPPTLTPLKVKLEALILISIGGRTLQCGVMYMFNVFVLLKLTCVTNCGIGKPKDLYNNTQNKKWVFFIFENKFEHVTSNTQFRLAQIRGPLPSTLCYKFVTGVNHHTDVLWLSEMMASNIKK